MPFYTRAMAKYLAKVEARQKGKKEERKAERKESKESTGSEQKQQALETATVEGFEMKKMKLIRDMLNSEVKRIKEITPAISIDSKAGKKYIVLSDAPVLSETSRCKLFQARHTEYKDNALVAKVYMYDSAEELNEELTKLNFRITRHIAKKHPYIVQTWDQFYQENTLIVIQEYANRGALDAHLHKFDHVCERQTGQWSVMLARALDYLGDIGVSHRSVQPHHILLSHRELKIKLTGFEHAVIYVENGNPIHLNCLPKESMPDQPNYQAPEVYGLGRFDHGLGRFDHGLGRFDHGLGRFDHGLGRFDPIAADVWSYGACLFSMLTNKYPLDFSNETSIDLQIQNSVASLNISDQGKIFLNKILKTNAEERLTINKILTDPWIKKFRPN